jgi:hypothetical protein
VLQSAFDGLLPRGCSVLEGRLLRRDHQRGHRDSSSRRDDPDAAVDDACTHQRAAGVPQDATAFAIRNGGWAGVVACRTRESSGCCRVGSAVWEVHPSSAGGAYVNMMMEDEGRDRVRAAYRGNYDRLVEIKRRYDPTNLFHLNHNIPPI